MQSYGPDPATRPSNDSYNDMNTKHLTPQTPRNPHRASKISPPPPTLPLPFGLTGTLAPLPGGRGLCYLLPSPSPSPSSTPTPHTILKPSDDPSESQWLSTLSPTLLAQNPTSYRLARPIPSLSNPQMYVIDG